MPDKSKATLLADPKNALLNRIKGIIKYNPDNPDYGLLKRGSYYWLCFYNDDWKTESFNLKTGDVLEARFRRDYFYRKATERGCGARNKYQFIAQKVLADSSDTRGFIFVLQFLGHTVRCNSYQHMKEERARIAREVLGKDDIPAPSDAVRHKKGYKYRSRAPKLEKGVPA